MITGSLRRPFRAGSFLVAALVLAMGGALALAAAPSPPAHYSLDPSRSMLRFSFVQAGASNNGRFNKFTTDVLFAADNLAASKINVSVDVGSLDTGDQERDDSLKGADLFDVKKFPQAKFVSSKITQAAQGRYEAIGKLTIRNVTKDIRVPMSFQTKLEGGKTIAYMTGRAVLKRLDFGVGQGEMKSTEWVADEVNVNFALRLEPMT
jgi:polyisoprenoid-binding protein YceI